MFQTKDDICTGKTVIFKGIETVGTFSDFCFFLLQMLQLTDILFAFLYDIPLLSFKNRPHHENIPL